MKLLVLDRPQDSEIIKSRDTEYFGPWAQPINLPTDLLKPTFEAYSKPESIYEAQNKALKITEDLLQKLIQVFPVLTGVKLGERFWKILFGYHIISLAGFIVDIETRQAALPEKDYVLGLPDIDNPEGFIPYSFTEIQEKIYFNDFFRQYLMGLYLKPFYKQREFIKYCDFSPKRKQNKKQELLAKILQNDYKDFLRKKCLSTLKSFGVYNKVHSSHGKYLFWDYYHLDYDTRKKLTGSLLTEQVLPKIKALPFFKIDKNKRQKIKESFPFPFGDILSISLPVMAFEGLPCVVDNVSKYLDSFDEVDRIYTYGQAFLENEIKTTLFALLATRGKKLISIQHGGGDYFTCASSFMDRRVVDEYISWGPGYMRHDSFPNANKIRSLPSVYLSGLKNKSSLNKKNKKWDALLTFLEENRYIKWLYNPLYPDLAQDYFSREKVLLDYFSRKKHIAAKVYSVEYGWKQIEWIEKEYSTIQLLTFGRLVYYACQSKIVIIDHYGTVILELLAMNHPFLATWDRRWFKGQDLFEKFIDKLIEVGIFYEHPQDLIAFYNKLEHSDIAGWWHDKKRQEVVKAMAESFALTSDDAISIWKKEELN